MTATTDTRLSRRSFVAGTLSAAAGIALGAPAFARAVAVPAAATNAGTTYAALVQALADATLTPTQEAHALGAFETWYRTSTPATRAYVGRVFDALDRGAGGSFHAAEVRQRRAQLDDWLHPPDPFEPRANARLITALAARQVAAAPAGAESASTSFGLPLGES